MDARFNYADMLHTRGQYSKAQRLLASIDLAKVDEDTRFDTEFMLEDCSIKIPLIPVVDDLLDERHTPTTSSQIAHCAEIAIHQGRNFVAAQLFSRYLDTDPGRDVLLEEPFRYNAACAAVLVASGSGDMSATLTAQDRTTWRQRGIAWLGDQLELLTNAGLGKADLAAILGPWLKDPDLATIRDEKYLALLSNAEHTKATTLWRRVRQEIR